MITFEFWSAYFEQRIRIISRSPFPHCLSFIPILFIVFFFFLSFFWLISLISHSIFSVYFSYIHFPLPFPFSLFLFYFIYLFIPFPHFTFPFFSISISFYFHFYAFFFIYLRHSSTQASLWNETASKQIPNSILCTRVIRSDRVWSELRLIGRFHVSMGEFGPFLQIRFKGFHTFV